MYEDSPEHTNRRNTDSSWDMSAGNVSQQLTSCQQTCCMLIVKTNCHSLVQAVSTSYGKSATWMELTSLLQLGKI